MALRLRCPWLQWKDPAKIWAGSGNPCNKEDMEIFYTTTEISIGNGKKTHFWHAPWHSPLMFNISKRKNWVVAQAMHDNSWVRKIDLEKDFSMDHFNQFLELWILLSNTHLNNLVEDDITWRLIPNGQYSAKSAYEVQFLGLIKSPM
jgi:hypothetical protein